MVRQGLLGRKIGQGPARTGKSHPWQDERGVAGFCGQSTRQLTSQEQSWRMMGGVARNAQPRRPSRGTARKHALHCPLPPQFPSITPMMHPWGPPYLPAPSPLPFQLPGHPPIQTTCSPISVAGFASPGPPKWGGMIWVTVSHTGRLHTSVLHIYPLT